MSASGRFRAVVLALAFLVGALPLAAQPAASPYRIGPRDLVAVKVFEVPELNVDRRVGDDGQLVLPLIGAVPAQGLTESELAERLRELLEEKYVVRASVSIEVREFRSRPIVVLGAVKSPGNLQFSGRWSLLEVFAAVGGLAGPAEVITILRRAENGLADQVTIRVEDLLVKADPKVNIPIFSNDLINVPAATEITIFFIGEVKTTGAVNFRSTDRVTLLTALARAGGLGERASNNVVVRRRGPGNQNVELRADYRKLVNGKEPDFDLEDGDVVIVKESFF